MTDIFLNNIFCILIAVAVLLAHLLQKSGKDKTSGSFTLVCLATLSYLVLALIAEVVDENPSLSAVNYIANFLSFFTIDFTVLAFCGYLSALLGNVSKSKTLFLRFTIYLTVFRIAVIFVLFFTGNLFTVENGTYADGKLVAVAYVMSVVAISMLIVVTLQNRKQFSAKSLFGILAYLIFPVVLIVVEAFTGMYALTGIALTFAVFLVYILIQSFAIEQSMIRESVLEEISATDLLTGLNNRRAYYSYIEKIPSDENIGVLFCDINGLKLTNDTLGHSAGDGLIERFAEILKKSFGNDNIFRISGDEFIVLVPEISENDFDGAVLSFRGVVAENDSIASVGGAYGKGGDVEHLVATAEGLMYDEKKAFHLMAGTEMR